jgi:hypothetical protein
MLDTWFIGVIRTAVPVAIGAVLTYVFRTLHVVIDDQTSAGLTIAVVGILTAVYYAVLHALEAQFPAVGRWLLALGLTAAQPSYAKPVSAPSNDQTYRPGRM